MVDFIPRGGRYDSRGLLARCDGFTQAMIAAEDFLKAQAEGEYPNSLKLRVWKSGLFDEFPWCLRWVPKENGHG